MPRSLKELHWDLHSTAGTFGGDRRVKNTLVFTAFYALAANVPYWFASYSLGILPLGWLCIEYALIGILALFVPRTITATLMFVMIGADLLSGVSKTYYLSPVECLVDLRFLQEFTWKRFILVAIVGILIMAIVAMTVMSSRWALRTNKRWVVAGLAIFIAAVLLRDYASFVHENGYRINPFRLARPSDSNKYSNLEDLWASRYPLIRLVRDQRLFGSSIYLQATNQSDREPVRSATSEALRALNLEGAGPEGSLPNIVLVLVESWGLDKDPGIRNSLVQPYYQKEVQAKYTVLQGTVPFYGSTLAGEARELCGNRVGFHIVKASQQDLKNCLPDRLAALGYDTIAAHGMKGGMFQRADWYPRIGFHELWFKDSFDKLGLPVCDGAFEGTCDAAIAGWIQGQLATEGEKPKFLDWLTLNSHLPLPNKISWPYSASCSLNPILAQQKSLCVWYNLILNVHSSVARLAASPLGRPTVFIVVGDHAPPFVSATTHAQFPGKLVPYILLIPTEKNN